MNRDKQISKNINGAVNVIVARLLAAVFAVAALVAILTFSGVFVTTVQQTLILLLVAAPGAICGFLVIFSKSMRYDNRTKYFLCVLMSLQAFGVALTAYSYVGTIILLLPILVASLYPKSKLGVIVSLVMIALGLILPPLALVAGFWDGGYYEFLYDLSFGRPMDTATLSDLMLTQQEQILSAIRFCSSQNILIIGGFAVIGRLIYRQTNKSFESQKDVLRLSETDELTGLLNRNCFERRIDDRQLIGTEYLSCWYFDVNGLHEMNNKYGHRAGDTMLQFVGHKIQEVMGEDNVFRVGGDEFVAFSSKKEADSFEEVKKTLEEAFARQGYHVSMGYAGSSDAADINVLVQQAEKKMYLAKRLYYTEHDRRR